MAYAINRGRSLRAELRRIAQETLDTAIALASNAPPGGDQTHHAVHEVRKASKRLRALLRLFRTGFRKTYRVENLAARNAAAVLAGARDRRVLVATLEKLAEDAPPDRRAAIEAARAAIAGAADPAVGERLADDLADAANRLEAIGQRVTDWKPQQPRRSAARGAGLVYHEAHVALTACRVKGPDEPWHTLRKHVKTHGYHTRLLMPLHPVAAAYYGPIDTLGKTLGDEHDLTVLVERVDALGLPDAARDSVRNAARLRQAALREAAHDLAAPLFRFPPKRVEPVVMGLLE